MTSSRHRPLLLLHTLVAVACVILIGLGSWQLSRKHWKEEIMALAAQRSSGPPQPLPRRDQWMSLSQEKDEYRRVTLRGEFLNEQYGLVYSYLPDAKGPANGPGVWVFAPVQMSPGEIIYVNRGFVPESRLYEPDVLSRIDEPVQIEGLLRWPEQRSWFTPSDEPERNFWYVRDVAAIARDQGLHDVAPFYVDLISPIPSSGLPQGDETRMSFRNNHLEYALTWFGLAITLLAVYGVFLYTARKERLKLET